MITDLIHNDWKDVIRPVESHKFIKNIETAIKMNQSEICPRKEDIFRAFELCSYYDTKVVIIGQDPYAKVGVSNGLAFSSNRGCTVPPSMRVIYKELKREFMNYEIPDHGDLTYWAQQGVLLLNTTLTRGLCVSMKVEQELWRPFTDYIISQLNKSKHSIIFMLWGTAAGSKAPLIDPDMHLILRASHPSPIQPGDRFMGCGHFERANEYLYEISPNTIDWQIPL